ncbi:hypothetical protein [Paenibacillus xylanexedens]|uniref:hypothetical protein n=1 Tax=Paenibacillus xylanexedens TaxID=528191 RepID=UPI000F9AC24D|nr:hypothetical protein [Paenibacillus xylanexedens]RPK31767.1 hypothetical protein EDO6_02394 [Paenibacillus xylanexedens]
MFTVNQLEELSYLAWWDLECPPLKFLVEDWKANNGLNDETIEKMMDILTDV